MGIKEGLEQALLSLIEPLGELHRHHVGNECCGANTLAA